MDPAASPDPARPGAIAIVGLSGRYPKSNDLDALWRNLRDGVDCVGEVDGSRWDLGFHAEDSHSPQRVYTRAGGFLDRIDAFDAEFFGMSPREARQVDPQHRLLLELTWEALESSGIVPASIAGSRTGVFVGISQNDYSSLVGHNPDAYTNIGSALSIAANRISYIFDLHGPSMSIDTACSSSLVALHQACRSLAAGDCSMALVGGVNILASMKPFAGFAQASMLSPDGRCKSFDADGKGYVRAEGGGIAILKPLADAERDGDEILAVIVGTSVNSDGRTMGMALPSGEAQEALLRQIYTQCGVAPKDVFYVEAHGTGTAAGDPIECGAISRVLGAPRTDGSVCRIGSIKSNIGHLESGAGMAGLTKVLLSIRHRAVPGNLHFNTPNPKIDFEGGRLGVVTEALPLPHGKTPLIFGINSFGFGGTNAHAILREYRAPAVQPAAVAADTKADADIFAAPLLLSAQSTESLQAVARLNAEALRALPESDWADYRATAALRRAQHQHRLVVAGATPGEAAERLERFAAGEEVRGIVQQRASGSGKLAFVFSGNGPQWWGMGRELLAESRIFRTEMEAIDTIFQPLSGWSLIELMSRPKEEVRIERTEFAQPLLFAQQVALCAVLRSAGIVPDLTFGHSVGEVAAAHISGALSREQATQVIFHRSQLQATTAGRGRMAALALSLEEAEDILAATPGWIEIAAINAPKAVTLAGDADALRDLCDRLSDEGRFARMLPLNYAFHTSAMDSTEAALRQHLADLSPSATERPFVSTVEGAVVGGETLDADYWWRNIRAPVRFEQAVRTAAAEHEIDVFLEIGPHPVLRDYVVQTVKAAERGTAVALATLRRPSDAVPAPEVDTLRTAIAAVHAVGAGDMRLIYDGPKRRIRMPAYPWNRVVHWRGGWELPDAVTPIARDHPLLGSRVPSAEGLWTNTIQPSLHGFLLDHVVQGSAIFPAAGHIELLLSAALLSGDGEVVDLEAFEILKPLVMGDGMEPIVQLAMDGIDGTTRIRSRSDLASTAWTEHARGRISRPEKVDGEPPLDVTALRAALTVEVERDAHYRACVRRGMAYGPHFQGVTSLAMTEPDAATRMALGEVHLPALDGGLDGYHSHPAVLDGCLQLLISLIAQKDPRDSATIPVQVGRIRRFGTLPSRVLCQVTLLHENERTGVARLVVAGMDGTVLMVLDEARFQKVEFRAGTLPIMAEDWRPDPKWIVRQPIPLDLPALSAIAARVGPAVAACVEAADRAAFHADVRPKLDALAGAYAAGAVRALAPAGRPFTVASLARDAGLPGNRLPALQALVDMLAADGLLLGTASGQAPVYGWTADATIADPEALRRALMLAHPGFSTELVALGRAGTALPAWLSGEIDDFPVIARQEAIEDTASGRLVYNRIAAEVVRGLVGAWPAGRPIRTVEFAASTGGLTASVLPVLPPERSDYLLADASEQAVARARNRFAHHHFLRAMEAAPGDVAERGFDIALTAGDVPAQILFDALGAGGVAVIVCALPDRLATLLSPATRPRPMADVLDDLARAGFDAGPAFSDAQDAGAAPYAVLVARKPDAADAEPAAREPVASAHRVLVVGPAEAETPFLAALTAALAAAGQTTTVHCLDGATSDDDMAALVAENVRASEFVHLAGFADQATDPAGILDRQDMRCLSAIQLARAIELRPIDPADTSVPPTLTVVTRGAFAGPGAASPLDPFQATVAGVTRVIANEQAAVGCRLIDVHAEPDDAAAAGTLADALLARDDETETLLLQGRRYVHRVRESSIAEQTRIAGFAGTVGRQTEDRAFRLDFLPAGGLDSLHLREIERREPGEGEIEIRVHAAGLNFRDVLWAMGMLPEEAVEKGFSGPTIGMECAGEVVRTGPGVTHLTAGDRVIAFASSCFASHVTTKAGSAARIPGGLSYDEAATVPTAFITAWYALDHLARLEPGESVLIHGAAGGVGLAALQIAKLKGAVVFATAGAPDKQALVRTMGADHVLSSRSLKFADDVMRLTGGRGVDVVLNSLAGEAITKGLQVLKPFGRFLEIGKRDLYANSRIGLRPFRQNLSYFGIDADTLLVERPALARKVFADVVAAMSAGDLRPLPHVVTPISRAVEAFRAMQQARHVGKLVIGLDGEPHATLPIVASGSDVVRPDATYLVTGGLSGFGLATAEWLVAQGARSVALLGRRGDAPAEAQEGIARIRAVGAAARAFAVDVSDRAGLTAVLDEVRATMPPLKGVIHSAALIEDAPLLKVDRDLMHRVMSAKMLGAWHLHELTLQDALETFVVYSSSSVVVGNPGQATYVAANAFLNALAEHRRALGLPALAVGWGAIKDAGFLTRNAQVEEMLEQRAGMEATPARVVLSELGRLMAAGACKVSAAQFNLMRLGQSLSGARTKRFSMLIPEGVSMMADGAGSMADALIAMSEEDRRAAILACVTENVARVVGSPPSQIEPARALSELGLDSLMAVELAEALEQTIGRPVSVMQMIQAGTVSGVVDVVARGFAVNRGTEAPPAPPAPAKASLAA